MKRLRRFGFAVGTFALGAGVLIACGDDVALELASVPEAGVDARDGSQSSGTLPDGTTSDDATTDAPIVPIDSGVDADEEADADAGPDADDTKDAQADVDINPVDAGEPDADAGDLAREFPARVASEICRTVARCCFGDADTAADAGVDGGNYDQAKCLNQYLPTGFEQSSPGASADFSKLAYDHAKATECLARIQNLVCGANAAEYRAVTAACYAALKGTAQAGEKCALASECAPGLFCNTGASGGPVCEPLREVDALCGDWTSNTGPAQSTCSNRFSGEPSRFCRILGDGGTSIPATGWTCQAARPLGSECFNNSWCDQDSICQTSGPNPFTCQEFKTLFSQNGCNVFIKK